MGRGRKEETFQGGGMHILLIVVSVSWVYTYVKTNQILHFKYVLFIVHHLYLDNAVFKERLSSHKENPVPRTNRIGNVYKA